MKSQIIMEIISYITKFLFVLIFVAIAMYFFEIQNVNNFRQVVNYQIERHGGLTHEALTDLQEHSDSHFNGRFEIVDDIPQQPQPFGTIIHYQVKATIPILFFQLPEQMTTFNGSAVSQVRGDDG